MPYLTALFTVIEIAIMLLFGLMFGIEKIFGATVNFKEAHCSF